MVDFASLAMDFLTDFVIIFVIFVIVILIGKYVFKRFKESSFFKSSRFSNPQEYLPEEELSTIRQVIHLIMIMVLIIDILYLIFGWRDDSFNLLIFDLIVSLYLAIKMDVSSYKDKLILFFLIPFGSFAHLLDPTNMLGVLDILHILVFVYFIYQYYKKFFEYTEDNSLGITIVLLFSIIFVSFFLTIVVEGVTPLDSIEMVSNAFTSNGYAVLGSTGLGKVNAIFLVWSGFILSGVGTATLTVAIVMRHVNEKFDHLEDLVRKKK